MRQMGKAFLLLNLLRSTSGMLCLNMFSGGCLGAGHQTPTAQKEAAAGSAGPRLRGGG